jgi:multiple sugar transport system permease protein
MSKARKAPRATTATHARGAGEVLPRRAWLQSPRRLRGFEAVRNHFYWMLIAPSLAVLAIITVVPMVYTVLASFTGFDITQPGSFFSFRGLSNYREVANDPLFWNSLIVQAQMTVGGVALQMLIGVGLALLLTADTPLAHILRACFLLPIVMPPIVVGLMWRVLFTPTISPLNYYLGFLGLNPEWLGKPGLAIVALIVADTWQFTPFVFLVVLANLQVLPEEVLEAAAIDGASRWQRVVHVILPLIRPTLIVVLLFRLIDSVKTFTLIFIMTSGGPAGATLVTNFYAYMQSFKYTFIGFGSAITVVLVSMVMILSYAVSRWNERRGVVA